MPSPKHTHMRVRTPTHTVLALSCFWWGQFTEHSLLPGKTVNSFTLVSLCLYNHDLRRAVSSWLSKKKKTGIFFSLAIKVWRIILADSKMISSMGSDIQYSTESLYPSVSFYNGMGEVARKSTELLQMSSGGGAGNGKGRAGRGQVDIKQQRENPSRTS